MVRPSDDERERVPVVPEENNDPMSYLIPLFATMRWRIYESGREV
jgi:hypothetical protein